MLFAVQRVTADTQFDVSGDATLATDYVFRGVSQTMSSTAIQSSIGVEHSSGLFGNFWASNVDFTEKGSPDDGADLEVDFLVGYGYEYLDGRELSLSWVRYLFPNTFPTFDYDYSELIGSVVFDDNHSLSIGYSSNAFGSGASGTHYAIATGLSLPHEHWLGITLGHYALQSAYDDSYSYGELSVAGDAAFTTWRIGFHATSSEAKTIFGERIVRPRVVITLSAAF